MQHLGSYLNFYFLPVASNDNEDLLSLPFPAFDLALIREIKCQLQHANKESGILLNSRKERRFFQEVIDAERYIMLRYFSLNPPELTLRKLKRHILDKYMFPKKSSRRRKKKV